MSLSLSSPQLLDDFVQGIRVLPRSAPAPIVFQNKLFVFYNGSGSDGIWYTAFDNKSWAPVISVRTHVPNINLAPGTSPAVVVFKGTLYLFYNGSGHDGTWYTTFDGTRWSGSAISVSSQIGGQNFLLETSPSATVYDNKLYLFWNGSENDGIWFTTFDSKQWTNQTRLNAIVDGIILQDNTSPAVCTVGDYLYVFYNGFGHDGTWFTRLTKEGNWDAVVSVNFIIPGGMNFLDGTSPAATPLTVGSKSSILLVWNGAANDGLWYSVISTDGTAAAQVSLKNTIGAVPVLNESSGGVTVWLGVPFIFWPSEQQQLWFTRGVSL